VAPFAVRATAVMRARATGAPDGSVTLPWTVSMGPPAAAVDAAGTPAREHDTARMKDSLRLMTSV
jgi:hypothetical protein